ncbi:histidine phosphatase family protein [Pontibacter sp. BT310]|jgi:phosphohistidine phosphatase|uniref:Histidine phosphatase family protein n=1 Tax=Pontibacter populi TaxID=890055 RepID=A0ABS6XEX7_9BACT|nr:MULTISPECIES: histidine phosphatase family protein [Pontibacter]MBJ6119687.1 histidine phosphatase family protein [Pontibacter sp. BT310]MBR0572116.1 histidine phosphatase family protein [Microvirga sp. STS03]MBW3366540.1 histidine phosphatase family protein [Pontibacter populi]
MQRYVLICRHAETYDPYPLQPDFERELTPEGIRKANETGKWVREKYQKVDALVASPARRASATAQIIANRLYFDSEKITYDPEIYNPKEAQLLKTISQLPDTIVKVLIVSHNPALTQLARNLVNRNLGYLEPGQILAITIDLERWEDIYITTGSIAADSFAQIL